MKHRAIRLSARSFARTAYSFACSALLATLARSAALICSLARSLTHSRGHGKEVFVYELNAPISYHSTHCVLSPRRKSEDEVLEADAFSLERGQRNDGIVGEGGPSRREQVVVWFLARVPHHDIYVKVKGP